MDTDNKFATHLDAAGNPVAFPPSLFEGDTPTAFHPTPCCGSSATGSTGQAIACKRCWREVDEWYGDVPRAPFTILEGRVQGIDAAGLDELANELVGMASRPLPGYPDDLVLTVDTNPSSSRRGFLQIISQSDRSRPLVSFARIDTKDRMDAHADILESCRSSGCMRAVDEHDQPIDPNELIDRVYDNHPMHRILNGSSFPALPDGNSASVYRDLDGRLVRAKCIPQPFVLDDSQYGEAGDYIARLEDDGPRGRMWIIKADRFDIEHTLETPGLDR